MKAIVIYFSRADENYFGGALRYINKGNTEIVAEEIQIITNADLFKVERKIDYAKDYMTCIEEVKVEQKDRARPELKAYLDDISNYDVIFIGPPIFYYEMSGQMKTLIDRAYSLYS